MKRMLKPSIVLAAVTAIGCAAAAGTMSTGSSAMASPNAVELQTAMRKLWADHVLWTRQYIVSSVLNDPSAQAASVRLLRNQEDIGNAIAPYYGSAAGAKLTDLLKQHILIAVDLVTAAKAGDAAKQADADRRWHQNAADIATFLSTANPNWPRQTLLDMLNRHLALTTQEAVNRLQQKWNDDVSNFDAIFSQAMMMADALSAGVVKQFPAKF
jgi:hypothetical protein